MKISPQEFEQMAMGQLDLLYRVARRLTRDADRAADLVQETYVRALRARDTFDLKAFGIRPWLVRIMQNLHHSRGEREARQPAAMEMESLEAACPTSEAIASVGDDVLQNMDEQLVHALDELPPNYQVVLLLWAVEEFTYQEIADAIDIPIGTVMSRLHRARQRLSTSLREFASERRIIRE